MNTKINQPLEYFTSKFWKIRKNMLTLHRKCKSLQTF